MCAAPPVAVSQHKSLIELTNITCRWASIGFAGFVVFGWIVEATVKWLVTWTWSHLQ
ncbi:MAG: hypothetical protein P4L80_00365 [Xanthobacteraceae bacterium]|nr:hypothetical protein [Xanthobacteraceae bacterium]